MEVSDTELGIPGVGTLRRWLREAPPNFVFTALAPKCIAESGFALTPEVEQALAEIADFAGQLGSRAVVFVAPETFTASAKTRAALKTFVAHAAKQVPRPILDCAGWSYDELTAIVGKAKVGIAFDPLVEPPPKRLASFAYLRLPGPSGYRSRYDVAALDRVVSFCRAAKAKDIIVSFRNIDRYENSQYVIDQLELSA